MKSSRFFFAFESQVEYWEKTLSHILETTEMMLQVQRQWRYLENIFAGTSLFCSFCRYFVLKHLFVGSEDIRRQLPAESNVFDKVNANWKAIMERLVQGKKHDHAHKYLFTYLI
jgi:dynein heavy chain